MNQKKKKMYKNQFMGEGYPPIPEVCKYCYGFSNWKGDRDFVLYEDRDCTECENRTKGIDNENRPGY